MQPLDVKRRRCLRCQKWFKSQHKAHRICPNCDPLNKKLGEFKKPHREGRGD